MIGLSSIFRLPEEQDRSPIGDDGSGSLEALPMTTDPGSNAEEGAPLLGRHQEEVSPDSPDSGA